MVNREREIVMCVELRWAVQVRSRVIQIEGDENMLGHITPRKYRMTPYQKITAKQKEARLNKINEYYQENPGCTIKQAVAFIPPQGESAALVGQYSKLRTELGEITQKDIHEYVYGEEPLRHRQRR